MNDLPPPRLLVLGAHPDDAEFHAGGLILRYQQLGHPIKIVSVTNGGAGHHECQAEELHRKRCEEASKVADRLGAEYEVWEFPDGSLQPTLDVRSRIIREIRSYQPDLVLTHRTNDYHPDHRAVGQAVQDASYLVTVPLVEAGTPALRSDPVVAYMTDLFTRPCRLRADILLDIAAEMTEIVHLLDCHRSQVYEWLPYNKGVLESVPASDEARLQWLGEWFAARPRAVADHFRHELCQLIGNEAGNRIEYAEAYEISEYAGKLNPNETERLFPGRLLPA